MQQVALDGGMEFADADVEAWSAVVVPVIQKEFVGEGKLVSADDVISYQYGLLEPNR